LEVNFSNGGGAVSAPPECNGEKTIGREFPLLNSRGFITMKNQTTTNVKPFLKFSRKLSFL